MTWDRSAVIPVILERIANGESLRKICTSDDLPDWRTVWRWLADDPEFSQQYARAHVDQADWHHERALEIVTDVPPVVGDTNHKVGEARVDSGYVAWQRLRWDAHRWAASKLAPKKYADKIDMTGTMEIKSHLTING